ncbi:MAG: DUF6348 family protein, partial [Methanomassiliicoccaceae archaeon]|nr:DUF6348 family protein [Methanomassiliicoccaceae archaeon]
DPRVPAEGLLHYCICYDGGPDEGVGADDVVGWMREMLGGVMDGGRISVPDIGAWVSVYPQLRAEGICAAILHMDIGLPSGESFYECSVGTGDDFRRAATTAIGSFYMGFYKGLRRMLSGAPVAEAVDSRSRRWNVFASDLVGIGDHPRVPDGFYWGLLGQAVPDHLGGRGVAYMKVYGARSAGTVTAECRVDDVVSGALSGILAGHVSEWGGDGFASHKQFFFLARAEPGDTYPYSQGQIDGYVSAAAEMYAHTEYDEVFPALRRLTGDACLADELHGFVPELCAHRAFDKVVMPERFSISADGRTEEYTRWQVTSYNMIEKAVGAWLDGGPAQEAFQWCVSVSALYGGVIKAKEGGTDVTEEGGEIKLSLDYNFHDGYVAR